MLVLASDNTQLYKDFRRVYQQYLEEDLNIKVFLVYGKDVSFEPQPYDLVYDVEENYYPGMITKTLMAFEDINRLYDYDFMIRTNISTFWDFQRLRKRLDKLSTNRCITGTFRTCYYDGNKKSQDYVAGVNLILSRDLVENAIEHKEEMISWDLPEDWTLSKVFIDQGIMPVASKPGAIHFMEKFTSKNRKAVLEEIAKAQAANHDHFRIKNTHDRSIDIFVASILLDHYYGKTLL